MSKFIEKWEKEYGVNDDQIESDTPISQMNVPLQEEEEVEEVEEQEEVDEKPKPKIKPNHIQLIEPIKERRNFNSAKEFDDFYQLNKDELNEKTTHKLNKMFSIPGYRITKIKGVLSLKNVPTSRVTPAMKVDALELKVNEIRDRVNECIGTVNKILPYFTQGY